MSGTATFTMVEDMIEAIIPTITVSSTSQRKRGPCRRRKSSMVVGVEAFAEAVILAMNTIRGRGEAVKIGK